MKTSRANAVRQVPRAVAVMVAALLAGVLVIPAQPAAASMVTVTDVTIEDLAGRVQIAILATGAVRHRVVDWPGKPNTTIVVDMLGARLGFPAGDLGYRKGDVARVRVGQFNETTVRVVVELSRSRSYTVQSAAGNRAVTIVVSSPAAASSNPVASSRPGSPAAAQAGPPTQQAQAVAQAAPRAQAQGQRRFTMEFRDAKMSDVLAVLARLANLNIVVAPEAADRRVTVRLVNVTLEETLDLLTRALGLAWTRVGANILVGTADKIVEQQVEIRYYPLRNARAADVAPRIEALIFGRVRPARQEEVGPQGQVRVVTTPQAVERTPIIVDERTNTLIVVATREQHTLVERIIRQLDVPIPVAAMVTRIYPLRWLNVDPSRAERPGTVRDIGADIVALLTAHLRPSTPTITFDYQNNALIVTGVEGDHTRIHAMLAQIDVPARQIMIEATVLDISLDLIRDLGFEWTIGAFNFTEVTPSPGQILFNPITRAGFDFGFQLRALITDGRGRLLANPRIVTKDGQPGEVFLGDQIPVTAGVRDGVPVIVFVLAGVTLNITPRINPDGFVTTRIHADVGAIRMLPGVQTPGLQTRRALTTLTVRDGTPIVIGGLIRSEERTSVVKIPLLGDIPIIGWLFRREQTTRVDSEVVFIITPRVLPKLEEPRP